MFDRYYFIAEIIIFFISNWPQREGEWEIRTSDLRFIRCSP